MLKQKIDTSNNNSYQLQNLTLCRAFYINSSKSYNSLIVLLFFTAIIHTIIPKKKYYNTITHTILYPRSLRHKEVNTLTKAQYLVTWNLSSSSESLAHNFPLNSIQYSSLTHFQNFSQDLCEI